MQTRDIYFIQKYPPLSLYLQQETINTNQGYIFYSKISPYPYISSRKPSIQTRNKYFIQKSPLIPIFPVGNHLYKPGIYILFKNLHPYPYISSRKPSICTLPCKKMQKRKEILETVGLMKRGKELETNQILRTIYNVFKI